MKGKVVMKLDCRKKLESELAEAVVGGYYDDAQSKALFLGRALTDDEYRTMFNALLEAAAPDWIEGLAAICPEPQRAQLLTELLHRCIRDDWGYHAAEPIARLLDHTFTTKQLKAFLEIAIENDWFNEALKVANLVQEPKKSAWKRRILKSCIRNSSPYLYSEEIVKLATIPKFALSKRKISKLLWTSARAYTTERVSRIDGIMEIATLMPEPLRRRIFQRIGHAFMKSGWLYETVRLLDRQPTAGEATMMIETRLNTRSFAEARELAVFLPESEKDAALIMIEITENA